MRHPQPQNQRAQNGPPPAAARCSRGTENSDGDGDGGCIGDWECGCEDGDRDKEGYEEWYGAGIRIGTGMWTGAGLRWRREWGPDEDEMWLGMRW